ncbi:autotransporter outer membrane beta-barrel domain-containing protein [Sinorhizobium sp. BJ1]|uniref:autotransporter outer membrane beta-barrel domain-containing protein n=1 Tax=Sinorhizobium sp. BJ1 TaxID=2035455 RepID=UPI000BE89296|nr:autotransporter outer membrane beta-barrel domain-containing protein [Sinorhizobium sp. BJ1]PDT80545.1 hypothetical protein CO676_27260 [Sinorhizobium sp. BJ1]
MRINAVLPVLSACLLACGETNAQTVPLRNNFDTYSQALGFLLGAGSADCQFVANPFASNLDLTLVDRAGNISRPGPIGPNLSRHCQANTDETQLSGGSVLGGGLASLQSTRTVSQFDVSRRRAEPCDPSKNPECRDVENAAVSNYFYNGDFRAAGNAFISLLSDGQDAVNAAGVIPFDDFSLYGQLDYEKYRQAATRYAPAQDIDLFQIQLGVFWSVSDRSLLGFKGAYTKADGISPQPDTLTLTGTDAIASGFSLSGDFQDLCGVPSDGTFDADEFSTSAFYHSSLMDNGFISAEVTASKSKQRYRNSLCTVDLGASPQTDPDGNPLPPLLFFDSDRTAGMIEGSPDVLGLSANLNAGYDWQYGGLVIGPRLAFRTSWQSIDSYSETEAAGSLHPITGASLRYGDQDIVSVQTRVGFAVSRPFALETITVVPFAQLDYIHEFANDQRTIHASFVEDGRPDPLVFSFKTNRPDRDYFELRTGVVTEVFNGGVAYMDGRAILANDLIDNYGFTGGLRISF